jgi:hypothetical protein
VIYSVIIYSNIKGTSIHSWDLVIFKVPPANESVPVEDNVLVIASAAVLKRAFKLLIVIVASPVPVVALTNLQNWQDKA